MVYSLLATHYSLLLAGAAALAKRYVVGGETEVGGERFGVGAEDEGVGSGLNVKGERLAEFDERSVEPGAVQFCFLGEGYCAGLGRVKLHREEKVVGIVAAGKYLLEIYRRNDAIHPRGGGVPIGEREIAFGHAFDAEVTVAAPREINLPLASNVAAGGIVAAGFAELAKKLDQIETFLRKEVVD